MPGSESTVPYLRSWDLHEAVHQGGRSVTYDSESCTLFVGGSSQEVYRPGSHVQLVPRHLRVQVCLRIDLEAGTFLTPIEAQKMSEVNEVATTFVRNCRVNASFCSLLLRVESCTSARHPRLPIVSCCGDGAVVESWDLRDHASPLQSLKVPGLLSYCIRVHSCSFCAK